MALNIFSKNKVLLDFIANGYMSKRSKMTHTMSVDRFYSQYSYGQGVGAEASIKPGDLLDAFVYLQRDTNIIWGGADLSKVFGTWKAWTRSNPENTYKFLCSRDSSIYINQGFNITIDSVIANVPANLAQAMKSHYIQDDFRSGRSQADPAEVAEFSNSQVWKDITSEQSALLAKYSSSPVRFKLVAGAFTGFNSDGFLPVVQIDFKKDEIRHYKSHWAEGGDFKGGNNISVWGTISYVLKDAGTGYWRWGRPMFPIRLLEPVREDWM